MGDTEEGTNGEEIGEGVEGTSSYSSGRSSLHKVRFSSRKTCSFT